MSHSIAKFIRRDVHKIHIIQTAMDQKSLNKPINVPIIIIPIIYYTKNIYKIICIPKLIKFTLVSATNLVNFPNLTLWVIALLNLSDAMFIKFILFRLRGTKSQANNPRPPWRWPRKQIFIQTKNAFSWNSVPATKFNGESL